MPRKRKGSDNLGGAYFDFSFYGKFRNGNQPGRVYCRNTRRSYPFNSYAKDKEQIQRWIEDETAAVLGHPII